MAPGCQCWAGKRAGRESGTGAGGRWACLHSLYLPRRQRSDALRGVDSSSGRSCLVRRESQWVLYRSTGTGRLDGDGALFHGASPEQVRLILLADQQNRSLDTSFPHQHPPGQEEDVGEGTGSPALPEVELDTFLRIIKPPACWHSHRLLATKRLLKSQ